MTRPLPQDQGPGLRHPLMGARLGLLLGALLRNRVVARRHVPLATAMVMSASARLPIQLLEQARLAQLRRRAPPPEAPLFIVGHWRSGTTHLHNLMGCSPDLGHISPLACGLPDEILTLGTWFRPLLERALPPDRYVDRVAVTPTSPQEDEIPLANLQPLSVFHATYFPKDFQRQFDRGVFFEGCSAREIARWSRSAQRFAEKIALQQGKPRLVIKNPVYTARLPLLRQLWPDSPFIHIRRNPYEVFVSTRAYLRKSLAELALQDYSHLDIEDFVLKTFVKLMATYERDRRALGPSQLVEVSYERLRRAPLSVLAEAHEQLGLPGWDRARPRVSAYLTSIAGYRGNADPISAEDRRKVDAAWAPQIAAWTALDS
ncbi:MAG: sulfotransferase [Rhodospirillales bacterium]